MPGFHALCSLLRRSQDSVPRGIIDVRVHGWIERCAGGRLWPRAWVAHAIDALLSLQVNRCLSIKGAEDIVNRPHAFEISTADTSMFFIADTDKVGERFEGLQALSRRVERIWQL